MNKFIIYTATTNITEGQQNKKNRKILRIPAYDPTKETILLTKLTQNYEYGDKAFIELMSHRFVIDVDKLAKQIEEARNDEV